VDIPISRSFSPRAVEQSRIFGISASILRQWETGKTVEKIVHFPVLAETSALFDSVVGG
jgi:hypothetical protein